MLKKSVTNKLSLSKTTLRLLSGSELGIAVSGAAVTTAATERGVSAQGDCHTHDGDEACEKGGDTRIITQGMYSCDC
jgi:hypothetical protein